MKYKNVYTKVNNLYEEYENNLDFDCICEDLGVYVYSANSCKFQDYKIKFEVKDDCVDSFSALENNKIKIIYNDDLPKGRVMFSKWHELGHIYLGHFNKDINSKLQEIEANIFARLMIIPHRDFKIDYKTKSKDEILKKYNISKKVYDIKVEYMSTDDFYFEILNDSEICKKGGTKNER